MNVHPSQWMDRTLHSVWQASGLGASMPPPPKSGASSRPSSSWPGKNSSLPNSSGKKKDYIKKVDCTSVLYFSKLGKFFNMLSNIKCWNKKIRFWKGWERGRWLSAWLGKGTVVYLVKLGYVNHVRDLKQFLSTAIMLKYFPTNYCSSILVPSKGRLGREWRISFTQRLIMN